MACGARDDVVKAPCLKKEVLQEPDAPDLSRGKCDDMLGEMGIAQHTYDFTVVGRTEVLASMVEPVCEQFEIIVLL
jgi:hypothetical protein